MESTSLMLLVIMSFIVLFICCTQSNTEGFLSINCGSSTNRIDSEGILWVSDIPFIKSRNASFINDTSTASLQYQTFAYFTNLATNKYCYLIAVKPGTLYLVRATFSSAALESGIPVSSVFDLFINGVKWTKVVLTVISRLEEIILVAKSESLSLCLARNSQTEMTSYLYISAIELRPLNSALYNSTDLHKSALLTQRRMNFGTSTVITYPKDDFDRFWEAGSSTIFDNITTVEEINAKDLPNQPPVAVLQTAITTQHVGDLVVPYPLPSVFDSGFYYFALYFCNIKETNLSVKDGFKVFINNNLIVDWLHFTSFLQCRVVQKILEYGVIYSVNITLSPGEGSNARPFINAAETYQIRDIQNMTHLEDVAAIRKIANSINVPDDWYGGDPCLPAGYSCVGIVCNEDNPSRVIILNLTNFGLSGNIPPMIASLTALTDLLLGSNNLSGSIPDLSSLKNLTTLELQNNQLTGRIPRSLAKLPKLNRLYLENNKLDGPVPPELKRPRLDLRVTPSNYPAVKESHKMKNWIVGCLVGLPLIVVLVSIFLWKYIHTPRAHIRDRPIIPREVERGDGDHAKRYYRLAVECTEEEIKSATDNYSTLIGKGGFGPVFRGELSGRDVAVKKLSGTSDQGQQEFENEVTLLCRLYHKNLVNLIGYCKQPIQALVYEYMPCGTLKDHLYGTPELEKSLDWNTRLRIALQAAEGLLYLHQGCNPPIIHRDIKCTNILLDGRMTAKVADFGLAKLLDISQTHVSTRVKGTLGYLDPEYFKTWSLTAKSDVYSFGVVLLEIISGKPPSDDIVAKAKELISCGRIAELMDSSMNSQYKLSSAWKFAEVAYACVADKLIDRPTMSTVVEELKEAVAFEFNYNSQSAHIPNTTLNECDSDMMPMPR